MTGSVALKVHTGTPQSLEDCLCNFVDSQKRGPLYRCQSPQDFALAMASNFAVAKEGCQDFLVPEILAPCLEILWRLATILQICSPTGKK
jgi:hypothetical protein